MGKWIEKQGWLKDYINPKQINVSKSNIAEEENQIVFILRCVKCDSRKVRNYGRDLPILYYKCQDCGHKFKVIEKEYQK